MRKPTGGAIRSPPLILRPPLILDLHAEAKKTPIWLVSVRLPRSRQAATAAAAAALNKVAPALTLLSRKKRLARPPVQRPGELNAAITNVLTNFPEVLCVDATYGTNVNRYRLFSFMATDSFGQGAFVQHSLLDGESVANMRAAVTAFKKNNPAWTNVSVLVIDKDFKELNLLREEFPGAAIILCQFHVIDYLHREISKAVYKFDSFKKVHLKNLVTLMVKADTKEKFDHYMDSMKKLCGPNHEFMAYFTKNWLNCTELWCRHLRGHIPHLDNNTNNRLEASWGRAKDVLSAYLQMDECILQLWDLQTTKEAEYKTRTTKIGHRQNRAYDEEMSMMAKIVTKFACDLVEPQYKLSQQDCYTYEEGEPEFGVYTVTSTKSGQQYAVDPDNVVCSCSVYATLLLPCRHVMFLRRVLSTYRSTIPCDKIKDRWLIADIPALDARDSATVPPGHHRINSTTPGRVLTSNQKYKAIYPVCQRIAECAADKGTRSFEGWLTVMKDIEAKARADYSSTLLLSELTGTRAVGDPERPSGDEDGDQDGDQDGDGVGEDVGDDVGDEDGDEVGDEDGETGVGVGGIVIDDDDESSKDVEEGDDEQCTQLSDGSVDKLLTSMVESTLHTNTTTPSRPRVNLNTASRPSGRPRIRKVAAVAKKRRLIEETKRLADKLHAGSDLTLHDLQERVTQNKLSLIDCGDVLDALTVVFKNPTKTDIVSASKTSIELRLKRPKCHIVTPDIELTDPTSIRYIFPEDLLNRCLEYGRHFREKMQPHNMNRRLYFDEVAVELREVGNYKHSTLFSMNQYHRLAKTASDVRFLLQWIEDCDLGDGAEGKDRERRRQALLDMVPTMDLTKGYPTGYCMVEVSGIAHFAGQKWLEDNCIYTAAKNICKLSSKRLHVVDPLVGQLDASGQNQLLDGPHHALSKPDDDTLVFCPVYMKEPTRHWCATVVDFRRKKIGVYDPLHVEEKLRFVENFVDDNLLPLISSEYDMEVHRFDAYEQEDSHSCGVLILQFWELYVRRHGSDIDIDKLRSGDLPEISSRDLERMRFDVLNRSWAEVVHANPELMKFKTE